MRAVFWIADSYEPHLVQAVAQGALRHGDIVEQRSLGTWHEGADSGGLMILAGMHVSRRSPSDYWRLRGRRVLHIDKGYTRGKSDTIKSEYWRISLDAHQPTTMMPRLAGLPNDRRLAQRWNFSSWAIQPGGHILICPPGRSECEWYKLGNHVEISAGITYVIRKSFPQSDLVFRPKPHHMRQQQWKEPPIGARWGQWERPIEIDLAGASWMITRGASVTLNAVLLGVPFCTVGPNWANRLSTSPDRADLLPPANFVNDELNRLAYLQWSWDEWSNGSAWAFIKETLKK